MADPFSAAISPPSLEGATKKARHLGLQSDTRWGVPSVLFRFVIAACAAAVVLLGLDRLEPKLPGLVVLDNFGQVPSPLGNSGHLTATLDRSGRIHLVWVQFHPASHSWLLQHSRQTDDFRGWTVPATINEPTTSAFAPDIAGGALFPYLESMANQVFGMVIGQGAGRGGKEFNIALEPKALKPYEVDVSAEATLLDTLDAVKDKVDGSLAYRKSCRMMICGSCGMRMDGGAVLACKTRMYDIAQSGHVPVISAMGNLPVVKDLVVDMDPFWEKMRSVRPWLEPGYLDPGEKEHIIPREQMEVVHALRVPADRLPTWARLPAPPWRV